MSTKVLDQRENFSAAFGEVFRSSGIFFCPRDVKTTISVLDYFEIKNGISVSVVCSVRNLEGQLQFRKLLSFEKDAVLNLEFLGEEDLSVELEFFSNRNMRIPYAAIMGVYETPESVSMVHTYGRNHSLHEIENGTAILDGNETCWFVSDVSRIGEGTHLAVFHNGHLAVSSQDIEVSVTQQGASEVTREFSAPPIEPFETVVWSLDSVAAELIGALEGGPAWFRVRFKNRSAFPRLLLVELDRGGGFQVTHSDIDYSRVGTDEVSDGKAVIIIPEVLHRMDVSHLEIDPGYGPYSISWKDEKSEGKLQGGALLETRGRKSIHFVEESSTMPSRLHASFSGKPTFENVTPFRTCVGALHSGRPPKHTHWMPVSVALNSEVHLTAYESLYPAPGEIEISFRLYSAGTRVPMETRRVFSGVENIPHSFEIEHLFPQAREALGPSLGYLYMNSNYGGFLVYGSLSKNSSFCLEHSF